MALNMLFASTPSLHREVPVPAGTKAGKPLIALGKPAVTLTARGDSTETISAGGGVTVTRPNGGISNKADSATVAFDGVFVFPVAGVVAATAKGAAVYLKADGTLTLTATDATAYGVVYDSNPKATATGVQIGA